MSALYKEYVTRSLVLITAFGLCACAPQSYYSSSSYSTSPQRASPYRRATYSPYRDYNSEYYEALRQRRLRALADSYKDNYNSLSSSSSSSSSSTSSGKTENSKTQRYYSASRLPVAATSISAANNDASGGITTTSIYATNNNNQQDNYYSRYRAYASRNRLANSSTNKQQDSTTTTTQRPRADKSDEENAKFAGIRNQEANDEESTKTVLHLKRKKLRRCLPFRRDAQGDEVTPPPDEQGRILWDVNVYNIYSGGGGGGYPPPLFDAGGGCGGFGGGLGGGGLASAFAGAGGLGGGGLLADPIDAAYAPPNRLNSFLQLFAPGILQNALAATARPSLSRPQSDASASEANDLANDPEVDPGYSPVAARPPPVRRPNRVYYDSAGAAPITPAQLVGGVATTVNGIIQQLTGNVQPVYPGYRSLSYGK